MADAAALRAEAQRLRAVARGGHGRESASGHPSAGFRSWKSGRGKPSSMQNGRGKGPRRVMNQGGRVPSRRAFSEPCPGNKTVHREDRFTKVVVQKIKWLMATTVFRSLLMRGGCGG
jgi:hypothetical protein